MIQNSLVMRVMSLMTRVYCIIKHESTIQKHSVSIHITHSPVITYCESLEKAQSQTHFLLVPFLSVFRSVKSAVDHILHEPSAEVVANKL